MKIGLFFGSFNPVHSGHLSIAKHLIKFSSLEKVWFVVSPQNPFKEKEELVPFSHRYKMIQIEADKDPDVLPCDVEQQLEQPNYTIITLELLEKIRPNCEFSLIIGSDNLKFFHLWKDYKTLLRKYTLYVYPREKGFTIPEKLKKESQNIKIIHDAPVFNISSTSVRETIRNCSDFSGILSPQVSDYIIANNLYDVNGSNDNGSTL